MPPRGLKALVAKPIGKLSGTGKYKGYRAVDADGRATGPVLSGITKRLATSLFSQGTFDDSVVASTEWTPGAWKGADGGLRRGRAVDSQVSRLASASDAARKTAAKFKFTGLAFAALHKAGLEPLVGQRVVLSTTLGIATAVDVLCFDKRALSIVVVELKCGFSGNRVLPATVQNRPQKMQSPCSGADDCVLNRHFSQLTVTTELLKMDTVLMKELKQRFDIHTVSSRLLYVCDRDTTLYDLPAWWTRRGRALTRRLGRSGP